MTAAIGAATKVASATKGAATTAAKGTKAGTGAKAAARKPTAGARTTSPGARAGGTGPTTAVQQRQQIQKIKDARQPLEETAAATAKDAAAATPVAQAAGVRSTSRIPGGVVDAGGAGGGFVLGVLVWVGTMTYLRSGPEGLKRLLRAKFLNQVTP